MDSTPRVGVLVFWRPTYDALTEVLMMQSNSALDLLDNCIHGCHSARPAWKADMDLRIAAALHESAVVACLRVYDWSR